MQTDTRSHNTAKAVTHYTNSAVEQNICLFAGKKIWPTARLSKTER